jgi:DNA-binding transcriptional MerR regulator
MVATIERLKIGEVAEESGLSVKTVRYYEEIGLLQPTVERSLTGYRLFNPNVLTRLDFIKRAQSLGLTLAEIKSFLTIYDRGELPCGEVKQHLQEKVAAVSHQIEELQTLRHELVGLLSNWKPLASEQVTAQPICPILQRK